MGRSTDICQVGAILMKIRDMRAGDHICMAHLTAVKGFAFGGGALSATCQAGAAVRLALAIALKLFA